MFAWLKRIFRPRTAAASPISWAPTRPMPAKWADPGPERRRWTSRDIPIERGGRVDTRRILAGRHDVFVSSAMDDARDTRGGEVKS
jgi:hypothetical protein